MNEIIKMPLYKIKSFKDHPYKVKEDESFNELKDSIKANGLLNPLIVRKKDNTYELISGHRRKLALEKIGCLEADCIVKELDDDNAIIAMVDSNMHREKILPSEKAFAYKMKLEALKRTNSPVGKNYKKEFNDTKS